MELTRNISTEDHSLDIDGEARVAETIELDEDEQQDIIQSLANGDMMVGMSQRAVWEELRERGTVVKRVEEKQNATPLEELFE